MTGGESSMGKIAFVFPGQGAQKVGMGRDAYDHHPAARQIFERADAKLGFELSKLIFNGPEEELKLTYHTQPALLTTSVALLEAFKEKGLTPVYVAGHSLGEYSALVAAGVLSFEDAVNTVQARGQFMDKAVPAGKGTMAAVLGADREQLYQLCTQVTAEVDLVELANVNCPGQIVISGSTAGVQAIVERGKEAGAKRVIPLEVSGPFHSSWMKPAAEQLSEVLAAISMNKAVIPVVANVTARPVQDAEQIRSLLVEQVYSPVLWEDSVAWMIEQGVDTFIEIGSGTVLAGLIKKIDRSVKVYSIHDLESMKEDVYV
jgi:[acyl-carrier-protein] S-malonyltransferase